MIAPHPRPTTRRALANSIVVSSLLLLLLTVGAPARAQNPAAPCTDGVFSGDVQAYYQQVLADHAANPASSLYSRLSREKQNMVSDCATRSAGPDSERYTLRELARDGAGNVIGRVYDYLDPLPSQVCQEAPHANDCRTGRYYYVAVVLSGCYSDNVFGDDSYAASAGWGGGSQGTGYIRIRQSDQVVAHASCQGSPGFNLQPLIVDLAGKNSSTDGNGSIINDADDTTFNENLITSPRPFGFHAATSSVWNMLLSPWDPGDNNANGIEERDGSEDDWSSPWLGADSAGDSQVATNLCSSGGCSLGYSTTWFDTTNLWEWQVVYEMSWDASSCTPPDADAFQLDFDQGTHASPSKKNFELCGDPANLASLTLIKDTHPDNPWNDFRFNVLGPSSGTIVLQDPGAAECDSDNTWASCGSSTPWNAEDRFSWTDLIPSDNAIVPRGPYRVIETGVLGNDETDYAAGFECRNVDPVACSATVAASTADPFSLAACAPVAPSSSCSAMAIASGTLIGTGTETPDFSICRGAHVICKFTNVGECVESANAIGDLQVFGGVETEDSTFSTAAVPMQSAEAPDSIFLASFVPLPDESRWPGNLDHYVLPLPLVRNAQGALIPDSSVVCVDDEDTGCLAWRAGEQLLTQAPTPAEVLDDRRIGLGADERRVTYSKADVAGVPQSIRSFDWSDSDAVADEHDLWDGLGLSYVAGDTASEAGARTTARSIINQTLEVREVTLANPADPTQPQTLSFVAGDFFHSDPVLVGAPANFFYLANDLEGNDKACDDTATVNRGYRCFFEKNRRRRHVLIAGSNDGEIRGFDAGRFSGGVVDQRVDGQFSLGSGTELFAHLPRPMLAHAAAMTQAEHEFGVDGGLVHDDVFIDPAHGGAPVAGQREWRTVVFGVYREGHPGVFALDVTQPDPILPRNVLDFAGQPDLAWLPAIDQVVPGCASLDGSPPANCGTLAYPTPLWEFEDLCGSAPCDEDGNGKHDLGDSWSQVNTGRVLVDVAGETVVKFVAVFGGGLDPDDQVGVGNWIYMIDVETGEAIYKRRVASAVPSEPAAVDTDQNGFLDTLYVGTAGGLLYKVDLSSPADLDAATGRISDPAQWAPFAVFDTGGRPIFFPPTVTFVASRGSYALAFGTGDREDLFSEDVAGEEGRFYLILDPGFEAGTGALSNGPLTESSFQRIEALAAGIGGDLLTAPVDGNLPGWVLELGADERVVTKALLLSGLLVFTTFHPEVGELCEYGGNGSVYALLATNANSIAGPDQPRAMEVDGFAGRPVVTTSGMTTTNVAGEQVDPFEDAQIQGIRDNLMDLFPADCRFGTFSLNVGVTLSNTAVLPVASVPVCVARKNWTEHF